MRNFPEKFTLADKHSWLVRGGDVIGGRDFESVVSKNMNTQVETEAVILIERLEKLLL